MVASRIWLRYGIWLILLLAFALSFFNLGARTLHGDEFHSIAEAQSLGLNLNGILYFGVMRFWVFGGVAEWWLRSLSVLFAVSTVAVVYRLALVLFDKRLGLSVSILLATAPFVLEYSQQIRFYTFFLFASCLTYLALALLIQQSNPKRLIFLVCANLLVVGAHFFGLLVVASEILVAFVATRRLGVKSKLMLASVGLLIVAALTLSFSFRSLVYELMSRWTNPYGDPSYLVPRGLSLAQFAKIPFTFFAFIFGERVYPLSLFVVLGLFFISFGVMGLVFLWFRRRENTVGFGFTLSLLVFPPLVYLVFDSLASPDLQGAAPRYLIFLLPLFYLVVAAGAQGKRAWLIVPLLFVNTGSLAAYWFGDWAYTDDLVNWRTVTQWVGDHVTPQTLILADGRATSSADYYFPAEWHRRGTRNFQADHQSNALDDYSRIILLSYNFHADAREQATTLMQSIARRYDQSAVWNKYPLFVYVYDRKPANPGTYRVDIATGKLNLPLEIYGLPFQDLRLPFALTINQRTVASRGAFGLPGFDRQLTRTIPLSSPMPARALWLASNLVGVSPATGNPVGYLHIIDENGAAQKVPLRYGFETSAWNQPCQPNACAPAFTWRKRLALLGAESYPGSWQEFDASIFAARIDFAQVARVRAVELERVDSPGVLYIWGIVLEP